MRMQEKQHGSKFSFQLFSTITNIKSNKHCSRQRISEFKPYFHSTKRTSRNPCHSEKAPLTHHAVAAQPHFVHNEYTICNKLVLLSIQVSQLISRKLYFLIQTANATGSSYYAEREITNTPFQVLRTFMV